MIKSILDSNKNNSNTKRNREWCLKNIPEEGIKIIEESFIKFLQNASSIINKPFEELLEITPITTVWKIKWLIEIARLPSDKAKITAINKIAQNPTSWKFSQVKTLCKNLKEIEKSLNTQQQKKENKFSWAFDFVAKLYNIDISKFKNLENKEIILFLKLLKKDQNAAKLYAINNVKIFNFLKQANITENNILQLNNHEILASLISSPNTMKKMLSIINYYKED